MLRLTPHDHQLVTAAVAEAELATNGEIVTIVADRSDRYHDVALHWAVLAMLLPMAVFAVRPDWLVGPMGRVLGGWRPEPSLHEIVTALLLITASAFLLALLLLRNAALRDALTPPATKSRRVRRRAIDLFEKAGIPIIGLVENMAGYVCPHCGESSDPFGNGGAEAAARELGIAFLGRVQRLPTDPLAWLTTLEGVPSAYAAARDGIDVMLRDRGLRRTSPETTAESLLRGAQASAALEGSSLPAARPGFECLFNTRQDSMGTQAAWGNWSVGIYIRPSSDLSPAAVHAEMQRVRNSGLPELAHRFRR